MGTGELVWTTLWLVPPTRVTALHRGLGPVPWGRGAFCAGLTSGEGIAPDCSSSEGCLPCSPAGHAVRAPSVGHRRMPPALGKSQGWPNLGRLAACPMRASRSHTCTQTCTRTAASVQRSACHTSEGTGPCSPPSIFICQAGLLPRAGRVDEGPLPLCHLPRTPAPGPRVPSPSPFLSAGPPRKWGETGGSGWKRPVVPGPSPQGGARVTRCAGEDAEAGPGQVGLLRFHCLAPGP